MKMYREDLFLLYPLVIFLLHKLFRITRIFVSLFFKVCKSFKLVTPPEAIIGFLKIFVLLLIYLKN